MGGRGKNPLTLTPMSKNCDTRTNFDPGCITFTMIPNYKLLHELELTVFTDTTLQMWSIWDLGEVAFLFSFISFHWWFPCKRHVPSAGRWLGSVYFNRTRPVCLTRRQISPCGVRRRHPCRLMTLPWMAVMRPFHPFHPSQVPRHTFHLSTTSTGRSNKLCTLFCLHVNLVTWFRFNLHVALSIRQMSL